MEKLELKHLAPYLPYGLKIQGQTYGEVAEMSCVDDSSVNITTRNFQFGMWADIFNIKPILRPLSDLTKELLSTYYTLLMDRDLERCISNTKEWPLNQSYTFTSWLFENHFDVFGLIPKGLAIDINTIEP